MADFSTNTYMMKIGAPCLFILCVLCSATAAGQKTSINIKVEAAALLKKQVMEEASWALKQQPLTVTAATSPRSAGTNHDFFSEADYFWPDPKNPDSPYVNRDGLSNPDNFVAHRRAMIRFSKIIGALASAYVLTHDDVYVSSSLKHLRAWFIDTATLMNPNLQFSQAVKGRSTGRSWGIIDGIHLMEVAQGVNVMQQSKAFDVKTASATKEWFSRFVTWLNTSKNGIAEKNAGNNHSTCWVAQVASFARLCNNLAMLDSCRTRFKAVLLPLQMDTTGGFPLELARTKPYGYSLFNLDAMAVICQVLSITSDNLWAYRTPDGKCMAIGIAYLYPYVADKTLWKLPADVMYWKEWPVAQPFLIFGAQAFQNSSWFYTWKKLDHRPQTEEVIRNLPIRHPLIWL